MRKIFLFLIILSKLVFSSIDECKTDVYFGNGILTKQQAAKDNAFLLEEAIKQKFDLPYFNKNIGEVRYAYNRTVSKKWDLFESVYQVTNLQGLVDLGANWLMKTKETIHSLDLEAQVDKYEASIKLGHRVLVVAHSQGNLFAQEAYEKLGERSKENEMWLQKYWEAISIASPDPLTDIRPDMLPRIGWDNDMVAIIGNSNDTTCNVRRVDWEIKVHLLGESYPSKPSNNYVQRDNLNDYYNGWWKATEGFKQKYLESNVHAFTFYMGSPLKEGDDKSPKFKHIYINPFDDKNLTDSTAKDLILEQIGIQLNKLKEKPSQWKAKPIGCLCKDKYSKMTHEFDPNGMDKLLKGQRVKDFSAGSTGKIYQVDGRYVRATCDGVTIEDVDHDDVCYVLKNDTSFELGKITGAKTVPNATKGVISVALDWENVDVNLDLDVRWDAGEYDIQDIECPKEHWVIQNLSSVTEGKRAVWVNLKESAQNDSNVTDSVAIYIKALGKTMPLVVDVNGEGDYEVGHVADIVIDYIDHKFVPRLEYLPKKNVHSGGAGDGGDMLRKKPTCQEEYGEFNCKCMPCSAKIIPYLEQALAGPLSGAEFKIYEANDYVRNIPLYTGTTSTGSDLLTAGIINVNKSITNILKDNTLYVIEARGGLDIDSNDDYIIDGVDVRNKGSFRALVLGKDLKTHGYKINILTEISYQVLKDKIGTVEDSTLRDELDDIATYLLGSPIYGGAITYADIIAWLPTFDKKRLFYKYDENFESIVQKIYEDQDIYEDAIALVYGSLARPRLKGLHLKVSEEIENNTYAGSIEIVSEGSSSIDSFTLDGEKSDDFRIELDGSIYITDGAYIDFETKNKYSLKATAVNADGNTTVSVNIDILDVYDAPVAKGYEGGILFSTAQSEEWVAKIVFDSGKSAIESIELIGEEARYFDINRSGDIIVSTLGLPMIKKNTKFHFKVIASNSYGRSAPVGVTLHINVVKDTPSLHSFTAHINEHSPENTFIYTVSFDSGSAPVDAFVLSGEGSENFSIDRQGNVRVSKNANLDYEKKARYTLNLGARNVHGESENVAATIVLNDVIDVPVLKSDQAFSVDENITSSAWIGNILKERGLSNVDNITLSSALFKVDIDGNVYLAEGRQLDFETSEIYNIVATATNSYGSSLPVTFIVNVQDVIDVATLSSFSATIVEHADVSVPFGKVNYIQGTSDIILFELLGRGNEKFEVDKDGTVGVPIGVNFDYEEFSEYALKIRALNASGYSDYVDFHITIENILDAPEIQSLTWTIDENTKDTTLNGNIIVNEGLTPISKIVVRDLDGNISTDIEVNLDGKVHVLANADLDYETGAVRTYKAVAYNNQGFSRNATLSIILNNILDAPDLENFSGSIDENVGIGTVVGRLNYNIGLSEIIKMSLETPIWEEYINPFSIDGNGTIRVKSKLDYEIKSQYTLYAYAINEQGRSTAALVSIKIFDSADGPVLNNFHAKISEDVKDGYLIGGLTYEKGLDPITHIALSGEGSENFNIDNQGIITLVPGVQLDYETTPKYHFWAQAFSLGDTSNIVDIDMDILDVNENARVGMGLWENANVKIYELHNDGNRTLLYEEVSSSSDEYNKSGLSDSHRLELNANKFYIYEVNGGSEMDANQDAILDGNPTEHNATLYAITKGSWVRQMKKPLSVTLMSDVCYRWVQNFVDSGDLERINTELQGYYKPIVYRDIDNIGESWYGNCRDALVYRAKVDQYAWTYKFTKQVRSFMKELLMNSDMEYYERYVNNILKYNTQAISRNDISIIDDINFVRYDVRYVSFGEGGEYYVDIFDISDENNSVKLSEMWLAYSNGEGKKILSNSKDRYLSITSNSVYSYGITDPLNPVGESVNTGWAGEINRVRFSNDDNDLYIANGSAGVWLVNADNLQIKDHIVYDGSCVDIYKLTQESIAVLVSKEWNSSIEIFNISDTTSLNSVVSIDINSSESTTLIFNKDQNKLFIGGRKEGASYLNIYRFSDNTTEFIVSLINQYYGKVIEIELSDSENEIVITTEYYRLKYDISSIDNPILLEEHQLQVPPG